MKGKGFFTRRTVSNMIVVLFGVLLFMALQNFASIRTSVSWFLGIISPFIIGVGMAYLLNMPMRVLEEKLFRRFKRARGLALVTTCVLFVLLVVVLLGLLLPQFVQSVMTLAGNLEDYLVQVNRLTAWASEQFNLGAETLDIITLSYSDLITQITGWITAFLPELLNLTVKIGQSIISVLTAFIAALYMLAAKDKLLGQTRKVLYAALPVKRADEVYRVAGLSNKLFSGFISGKVLDSAIIGAITYVFMMVMNLWVIEMPFAPLISVVIGVTNIIPFFGPFIGAIPSVLILLLVNPWSALWFVVFVIVLQQFDGNFLGPKILGETTGLPPLWVLVAIIVGGGLFGFLGMIFGVPTVAVLYTLVSEIVAKRLRKKGLGRDGRPLEEEETVATTTVAEPAGPDET